MSRASRRLDRIPDGPPRVKQPPPSHALRRSRLTSAQKRGRAQREGRAGNQLTEKLCQRAIRSYVRALWLEAEEQKQTRKRAAIWGAEA